MPLYEYRCESCGKKIEVIQKYSDDPLSFCKECGGKLEKLMSAPAIRFKGSGWYVNDYASRKSGGEKNTNGTKVTDSPDTSETPPKKEKSSSEDKGAGSKSASDKTSSNKPKVA
jgi:putative FmdB family regulatory protein